MSDAVKKKEEELREAIDDKFRALHETLKSRDLQIKKLKEQLETLLADFRYNLTLLANRDADLERSESSEERLKAELERKENVANDLKIKFDDARVASRRNFLEYQDHRQRTQERHAEKDATIAGLKSDLEKTVAQCSIQLQLERENQRRRLHNLAKDAGRRYSKLKNQCANAISQKQAELEASVAQSDSRLKDEADRVAKLQQDLEVSNNKLQRLKSCLVSSAEEFKENEAARANEANAQIGMSASRIKELTAKVDESKKEAGALLLDRDNLTVKLAEAEKKIAERDRILNMMGTRNLLTNEHVVCKDEEFQQLKKQNNVLRCVIKEMKRKMRGEAEGETDVALNEFSPEENTVDEQKVLHLENAIGLLKMQMFQNLKEKLASRENGTGDPKDPNFGEVRIMLLEEKLDRATENIGKTVALEKKELLAEMKNVRKEIALKLTSENLLGNSLVVSRDALKSDQILEGVRKDIHRLELQIGKIRRENDIEIIERDRLERGISVQSLMRHNIVTKHDVKGQGVDASNIFYLPIPPMQFQRSTINSSTRKLANRENKMLQGKTAFVLTRRNRGKQL